jgi:HK97 family phage major capsid protein
VSESETLKKLISDINADFAAFKQAHTDELAQLRKQGAADVVTSEKLERINAALSDTQTKLLALEKQATRPGFGGAADPAATLRQANRLREANGHLQSIAGLKGLTTKAFDDKSLGEYEQAFDRYLRQGTRADLDGFIRQDFQISTESDGGFLVPPDLSGRIIKRLFERSDIRSIASVQPTTSSELSGIDDIGDIDSGWRGETDPVNDNSTGGQFGRWAIQVEEMWTRPKISTRLLADAMLDMEAWLSGKIGDRLSRMENAAFVSGNGRNKPRGLLSYPTAASHDSTPRAWGTLEYVPTGYASDFAASSSTAGAGDSLFNLTAALKPAYRQNARWVGSRFTFAGVRKLKSTTGEYLWAPGDDKALASGIVPTLLGYPLSEAEDMPAIAANAFPLAFGDFQEGYQIADRAGITILRDPYTAPGYVRFYTTKRTGGGVVNFDAIKLLKIAAS